MYKLAIFPLTLHAGSPWLCSWFKWQWNHNLFLEQAHSDIFSTSQQDINTNVLKFAEMAVRCSKLTHMELLD